VEHLDASLAALAKGAPVWAALGLALLLGLRHATDPDHLAAVTTLVASDAEDGPRAAGRLGFAWGMGHALTLFVFGAPVVALHPYLPAPVQRGAEALVGVVVVLLGVRLWRRWRSQAFAAGTHSHACRKPSGAFALGLLHGFGGSAGVGVLILAAIPSRPVALVCLALLAGGAALSMTALSTGLGVTLVRFSGSLRIYAAAPLVSAGAIAFGSWYALTALGAVPPSL
jgi:high-affinity nickel-transport protein